MLQSVSVHRALALTVLIARPHSALTSFLGTATPIRGAVRHRHPSVQLVLTPAQQYAQQQAAQREARMRRLQEEEEEANRPSIDPAVVAARAVELQQFKATYAEQLAVFDSSLFPEADYKTRNDASRKDGYWSYVAKGEEPPLDFTYGEFPLPLFSKLVDRACQIAGVGDDRSSTVLADLGSGTGRLALWAAATSSWKSVRGVEYLPAIAATASDKLAELKRSHPHMLLTSDVQVSADGRGVTLHMPYDRP